MRVRAYTRTRSKEVAILFFFSKKNSKMRKRKEPKPLRRIDKYRRWQNLVFATSRMVLADQPLDKIMFSLRKVRYLRKEIFPVITKRPIIPGWNSGKKSVADEPTRCLVVKCPRFDMRIPIASCYGCSSKFKVNFAEVECKFEEE